MSENKEMICLNVLETLLQKHFDKDEYCLNGTKESAICMTKNGKNWDIFEKEKNSLNDYISYSNVVEASIEMLKRMFLSESDEAIGVFLENIIVSKIA